MVVVSYSGREINAKLVYYGCGLSGKTTNLESIYEAVPETSRGKMVSMKTQSDRTLFFDLLPLDLGEIMGFKTRFLLYTVPGQVFYNATRKLVLKGADAIVFVADSEVGKMEENKESLANLRANMAELGLNLDNIPWVLQYNKRDLPNVYSLDELNKEMNPGGKVPTFEAVATDGKGVFETFRGISHLLMEKVTRDLRRTASGPAAASAPRTAAEPAEAATAPGGRPAGLSSALGRSRDAQGSHAPVAREAPPAVDYGREIDLGSTPSLTASAPASTSTSTSTSRPEPMPLSGPAARTAPSPARSVPFGNSPSSPGLSSSARSSSTTPNAGASAPEEVIVPIHIGTGGTHEIVLRIVLKIDSEGGRSGS